MEAPPTGWQCVTAAAQGNLTRAISGARPNPVKPDAEIATLEANSSKQRVRAIFEQFFKDQGGSIQPDQLRRILKNLAVSWTEADIDALASAEGRGNGSGVTCDEFLDWIFASDAGNGVSVSKARESIAPEVRERGWGSIIDDIYKGNASLEDAFTRVSFAAQLAELIKLHPYLEPGCSIHPHPVQYYIQHCRGAFEDNRFAEAQEHLRRGIATLDMDKRQIAEAFRRFDTDGSGHLDAAECRFMSAYLGWGEEEADLMDLDKDGRVTLEDYQAFIGRMGGVQQLFEHRRLRISASRKDVCDQAGLAVGARVRAHYYVRGQKSRSWREAQVLGVHVERKPFGGMGPVTYGVLLEFGFGTSEKTKRWKARQVVPTTWVLSGVEDAMTASALREIGLLDEQQSFWALLLPDSELHAVERLEDCQRRALANVRGSATTNHEQALTKVRERFVRLGYEGREVEQVLSWVQDLAPIVIHIHIDRMGHFMETDEFYRNQFETKTSCGAYDPQNNTRKGWEHNLFGGAYDDAKGFDRVKYGALNILNDYRGVVRARQYGDSYLVLKDVRLRTSFAATDSGGIQLKRLAVLDKYAHVLSEFNDNELKALINVGVAATTPTQEPAAHAQLLRGSTEDCSMDWVTIGFPDIKESSGKYFFEIELQKGCAVPQVGLLSSAFECMPRVKSTQGVGDDEHGWSVDGQNVARWHGGVHKAWGHKWETENNPNGQGYKGLSENVVVGVAFDIDARSIWFSSNGVWDAKPAFDASLIPEYLSFYPAVSLRGRMLFNFGPDFRHGPPKPEDVGGAGPFLQWSGGISGSMQLPDARLGNEEILSIYKEIQVHGEVSLRRNVQRLVAASKYRESNKTQRTYSVIIKSNGRFKGTYERAGAHNDMPFYRCSSGAIIYCDPSAGKWFLHYAEDFENWSFWAPMQPGVDEPPRGGWQTLDDMRGMLPAEAFKLGCKTLKAVPMCTQGHPVTPNAKPSNYCDMCGVTGTAFRCSQSCDYDLCKNCYTNLAASIEETSETGLSDEAIDKLVAPFLAKDAAGNDVVYRVRDSVKLEDEWSKLESPVGNVDTAWDAGLKEMERILKEQGKLTMAQIVESQHPYDAKRHKWVREVQMDGANGLVCHFCSKSCTLDNRARLKTFTGGLRREAAGVGSRVEVPVPGGEKIWGIVSERGQLGDRWIVRLDVEDQRAADEEKKTAEWPAVGDKVEAKYLNSRWYEATIVEIRADGTYLVDWYDKDTRDREKTKDSLRRPSGKVEARRCVQDLQRYAMVPEPGVDSPPCLAICLDNPAVVSVTYSRSATVVDEQGVGGMVGDEIARFGLNRACPLTPISIEGFAGSGPAQEQGVKLGWYLDLVATFSGPSHGTLVGLFTGMKGMDSIDPSNPGAFLDAIFQNIVEVHKRLNTNFRTMTEVILVFTNSCAPGPVQVLPEAYARYGADQPVSSEVVEFAADDGKDRSQVRAKALLDNGPAKAAGVRTDWLLNLDETLRLNPGLAEELPGLAPPPPPPEPEKPEASDEIAEKKAEEIPSVVHELVVKFEERDEMEEKMAEKMTTLIEPYGVESPYELESRFPGFEPEIKVTSADGEELSGPGDMEGLSSEGWPVTFKIKLPKLPEPAAPSAEVEEKPADAEAAEGAPKEEERDEKAEALAQGLKDLLEKKGLTLVFTQPFPQKSQVFQDAGTSREENWKTHEIPGDFAEFEFSTDGDGGDQPENRWGVLAIVLPKSNADSPAPSFEEVDAWCHKWVEMHIQAEGIRDMVEVERNSWDEGRLRALCARFGWEFSWQTEDGERRRRARERWDEMKLSEALARPLPSPSDPAEPDGSNSRMLESLNV